MSGTSTLNLADYTPVWNDNFANDTTLNASLFPVSWGNSNDFSFANGSLTLTSYASEGWSAVGFMQADSGATAAQGYGLYSVTASTNAGQGVGVCAVMWPSNNSWPGPEIDLLENWSDPSQQTGYATIHWAGAGNSNQQDIHQFSIDLTKPNTFAMDWRPGSLTYYINGTEIFQVTGSEVPKDAAQGGVNESFGAEVTAAGSGAVSSSVSLHLYDMSYSAYTGTPTGGTTTPTPPAGGTTTPTPPAGGTTTPTTPAGGTTTKGTTISLSSPGTVQEASKGAGVNVTETVSAAGLTTVYEAVFTSASVAESGWTAVSLNGSGQGTFTAHLANTGDYVVAVNNPNTATVTGWSSQVTITDAAAKTPASIALSNPATAQEASKGAGVTETETVTAPGLTTVYEAVFTSANVAEEGWTAVSLNGSGQGTFSAHFQHSGDYIVAVDNTTAPVATATSSAISITDPSATPATITLSICRISSRVPT